jgi:hypothetical protein
MNLGTSRIVRLSAAAAIIMVVAFASGAMRTYGSGTGTTSANSGFEGGDGNLVVNTPGNTDWNSFASTKSWTGTAPYRLGTATANGWTFTGFEDAIKTNDTSFVGGVKQDDNCPGVNPTGSAPNKDDLKRIYLATNTIKVGGVPHTFLALAWERAPQNTVNSSTHVGFEFNQGTTPCPGGSDGLVQRTLGDLLFVYDFEGSSSGAATISVRTWIQPTASSQCEVPASFPNRCWSTSTDLVSAGFADALVNESSVADTVAPSNDTLGASEFGEAVVDLTGAKIFNPNVCESFGQAEAVSRSSGNSAKASMEDLGGPGAFSITNCGEVIIKKHTDPRGLNQSFSYTSNFAGSQLSCSLAAPNTATSFSLNDSGNTTSDSAANTQDCTKVPFGSYTVTEGSDPSGFKFESLSCTATGTGNSGTQDSTTPKQADITLAVAGTVTCTYVNQGLGEVKIIKHTDPRGLNQSFSYTSNLAGNCTQSTATSFSLNDSGNTTTDSAANTQDCTNVPVGNYTVTEGSDPTGFQFEGLSCTASGTGSSGSQDGTVKKQADITVAAGGLVTCTYTNQQLGEVKIIKHTDPRGLNQSFSYTSNFAGSQLSCSLAAPNTATSFSLNDSGNTTSDSAANTQDCTNVPPGSYTVTEGSNPSGFTFEGLSCTASGTGSSGSQDGTTPKQADITLGAGGLVTCTYTNQGLGAIKITKTSSKAAATALSGAHFELCTNNGPYTTQNPCSPAATGSGDLVTGSDGTVCVDGLGFASYYVTETSPPTGYATDDTSTHTVTVNTTATCSAGTYAGQKITFTDTPLTDLLVRAKSQATGGTKSTITCTDASNANIGNSPQGPSDPAEVDANGLKPGTYTCTVVVDP